MRRTPLEASRIRLLPLVFQANYPISSVFAFPRLVADVSAADNHLVLGYGGSFDGAAINPKPAQSTVAWDLDSRALRGLKLYCSHPAPL